MVYTQHFLFLGPPPSLLATPRLAPVGWGAVHAIRWKKQFAGMGVAEIRRLKQLEGKNAKLKKLVADLALDKTMLQDVLRRKW